MANPTVQDFLDAYEKTGVEPIEGIYYNPVYNCACAAGAYALAHKTKEDGRTLYRWLYRNLPVTFVDGVVTGFDGYDWENYREGATEDFIEGYETGREVRRIMFGEKEEV